ncbi:dUTPase [Staphylococcus pseudintermedius]|uniref:dUTPase n=1 Tax=Staphylococcus pseudintermedius TaxID=283734 RepID=A0A317Z5U7_STAPS|nr:dUTP diphosphatase [Staphylococcus pseudintermedius]PWZ49673.1 dUTPase [Staphylococcus pseudintermedius]PWZ63776.1 dUTPase [Staphylococcus pseudintermedius]PWZ94753.1 dUTPase [Staphylococcus pseudintermedius]PXA37706.1 dUTPase [Staphylococcus pseudintermedius]
MTNTLTVEQLEELLQIQKEFDDRIPTLNLEDSKIAYVVEFFEWFNTLETFKNWKKKPGKPLEVQLDELADLLAFGLSIANQKGIDEWVLVDKIGSFEVSFTESSASSILDNLASIDYYNNQIPITFDIAEQYYTIDQLITAYKKKMEINHARQDGTADAGKGYV